MSARDFRVCCVDAAGSPWDERKGIQTLRDALAQADEVAEQHRGRHGRHFLVFVVDSDDPERGILSDVDLEDEEEVAS